MTKNEFMSAVSERLSGLPQDDIDKALEYFSEMIDEHIEDGLSEEEAVSKIGSIDDAVSSIPGDIPVPKIIKTKAKKDRSLKTWELVLLIAGSPLWISLLIASFAVLLGFNIAIWAIVAAFYMVTLALALSSVVCIAAGFILIFVSQIPKGLFAISAGAICAGLAILFFHLSNLVAKGIVKLSKKIILAIKLCFRRKEKNKNE